MLAAELVNEDVIRANHQSLGRRDVVELQRRQAYECFDSGRDVSHACMAIRERWSKQHRPCLVTVRNWRRAWEVSVKRTGFKLRMKNAHASWVRELAFNLFCTGLSASEIYRKLKAEIPKEAPALFTLY